MQTLFHILVYLAPIFLNSCFPQNNKQSRVKSEDFPDDNPISTETITPHNCLVVVAMERLQLTIPKTSDVLNLNAKTVLCAKGTSANDPDHLQVVIGQLSGTVESSKVKCDDGSMKSNNEKTCKLAFEGVEKLESSVMKPAVAEAKKGQANTEENTKSKEEESVAIAAPKSVSAADNNTISCSLKCGFFCNFIDCSIQKVTIAKFPKNSFQRFDKNTFTKDSFTLSESPFCSIARKDIDETSCSPIKN